MVSFHAKLARLSSLVLVLGLLAVSARGQEDEQGQRRIKLEVGRSKVVRADWPVTRVSVADSEIADVQVLSPNEVLVVGKSIGVTDLVLWNEQGKTWEAVIDVELDLRQFERELKDYFPTATLSLSKSSDVVVVRGTLRRIEDGEHLVKVLKNVFNDEAGKKFVNLTSVEGGRGQPRCRPFFRHRLGPEREQFGLPVEPRRAVRRKQLLARRTGRSGHYASVQHIAGRLVHDRKDGVCRPCGCHGRQQLRSHSRRTIPGGPEW
jgi:hypothetical protein